jgi:CheY-like chemotaxis protein
LQNALRFTPAGRRVWVNVSRDERVARLSVVDEGRGIQREHLASIFEMFTQSRQGLARSEGGLGLGLTIAERIAAAHGGRIEAASDGPGLGATFTVALPLDERAVARQGDCAAPSDKLRIVVVEDQNDAREALEMLLDIEGHEVLSAHDGKTGLELILEHRPQIALLDIGLPDIDGYAVAAAARERLGRSIQLVAMSGYGQPEDVRRSEKAGFDRHLTKPVDPRRLAAALEDIRSADSMLVMAQSSARMEVE